MIRTAVLAAMLAIPVSCAVVAQSQQQRPRQLPIALAGNDSQPGITNWTVLRPPGLDSKTFILNNLAWGGPYTVRRLDDIPLSNGHVVVQFEISDPRGEACLFAHADDWN